MFASIAFSFIFFVQNKEKAWLTNNPGRRNVRTYGRAHTYTHTNIHNFLISSRVVSSIKRAANTTTCHLQYIKHLSKTNIYNTHAYININIFLI